MQHGPPPWWSQGGHPGAGRHGPPPHVRRRFLRGFVGAAILFLVVALGAVVGVVAITSRLLGDGPTGAAVAGAIGLLVLVVVVLVATGIALARRFAAPLADVMDAAERVRGGDTTIRVHPRGPREVRRLAATFNEMVERLDTDERRRRALLADLAHELRTPMSVVRGNVEGMLDGVYEAEPARLRTVVDEVAVLERLLDDLATLSTAEAGALHMEVEEVAPSAIVDAAVRAVGDRAHQAGVTVATDMAGAPGRVEVDPMRIEQVLVNLLTNAVRHTPRGGEVVVSATDEAGLRLVVADTGSGIDPDDLPHVFDRFVRSADSGGSGLGLAIARRLVEAHSGTIAARPRDGGGTEVVVVLPDATA
ncbi:sensor histidine kinase [Salsipaludibacter albus]|uniref:sensor histidine kinase n=1 Tax=Salsipaludibacter albus TaxID=2849650 RepID=UPI001EE46B32|nr:HAMP domain-containing histidine kinase [Salsipaludibacter albus]